MTVLAHLSDPHIGATPQSLDRFRRVLAELDRLPRLDGLVITGDLADHGRPDEYASFVASLPAQVPTLVVPGNHDVRAHVPGAPVEGPVNRLLDVGDLRVVGLDSSIAGRPMLGAVGIVSTMRLGGRADPLADTSAMPGLAVHTVDDDGGIVTLFHALAPA